MTINTTHRGLTFSAVVTNASPFWKGILWASRATSMGYQWPVGDGKSVRFWVDHWFGSSSLAIQFFDIHTIYNEQNAAIRDAWDGTQLKITFRRGFSNKMMQQWEDLVQVVSGLILNTEPDQMVWKLHNSGIYNAQSFHAVINFRGVTPSLSMMFL